MVELFRVSGTKPAAPGIAALPTPFGDIGLAVEVGGKIIGDRADVSCTIPNGSRVLVWTNELLRAELLLGAVAADLPAGMAVSACHLAVWRLHARVDIPSCRFIATWSAARSPAFGGPDSGQGLAAQSWNNGETTVSLGTADAEWLARCGPEWELPASWSSLMSADDPSGVTIEEYRPDGLALDLPGLTAGEGGQIHFFVAWAPTRNEDSATWYAVDHNPQRVAAMLGAE